MNFNGQAIDVLFLLNKEESIFHLNDGDSFKCFSNMNIVQSFLDT